MSLKEYLIGLILAVAFAACSSDNSDVNVPESPEIGRGDNYLSVAIEMAVPSGSRTTTDDGLYNDGTDDESKVGNIVFFFFDEAGNCIEVQKIDNPIFMNPAKPSLNPNITNYGIVEIRLKAGLSYSKVGVALNSPVQNATELKSQINSISDLLGRTYNYVKEVKEDGSGQVMSNSIYYSMDKTTDTPADAKKVDVVPITAKNIYSSAQKNNIDQLIASGEKEYVDIFVERVVARIDVSKATFDMTKYYVYEENGEQKKTITVFDHVNGTSKLITVRPVVKGMIMNVLAPKTALVKPLHIDEVGYGIGEGDYKNFQWNDPANKRSYWASTAFLDDNEMLYYSWNQAVARGSEAFTQYIHPNTQDYKPVIANEGSSLNTKLMVVAELHEVQNGEVKDAVDLVMFGADYMLSSDFLAHVANIVNKDVRTIDWDSENLNLGAITLTDVQKASIKSAVNSAFQTGYKGADFKLDIAETSNTNTYGDEDWAAVVHFVDGVTMPAITGLPEVSGLDDNGLSSAVTKVITNTINSTIGRINANRILYWKGGRTYFYTNIRHQGFTGLVGNGATDFLYGVVRNHIYKINLNGIYGLGTPVIDPTKPINPDRPNDGRPGYIKAKINILPWRVVTYNATIH